MSLKSHITIIYDGDCLMCRKFHQFIELRKKVTITRYDINSSPDIVKKYHSLWYDSDKGMIIDINGTIYHGAMALTVMDSLLVSQQRRQQLLLSLLKTVTTIASHSDAIISHHGI